MTREVFTTLTFSHAAKKIFELSPETTSILPFFSGISRALSCFAYRAGITFKFCGPSSGSPQGTESILFAEFSEVNINCYYMSELPAAAFPTHPKAPEGLAEGFKKLSVSGQESESGDSRDDEERTPLPTPSPETGPQPSHSRAGTQNHIQTCSPEAKFNSYMRRDWRGTRRPKRNLSGTNTIASPTQRWRGPWEPSERRRRLLSAVDSLPLKPTERISRGESRPHRIVAAEKASKRILRIIENVFSRG